MKASSILLYWLTYKPWWKYLYPSASIQINKSVIFGRMRFYGTKKYLCENYDKINLCMKNIPEIQ